MFLPTIGLVFQILVGSHPQDEAMSPQAVLALLVFHSPKSIAQNLGSTPTIVLIHQLSSPSTYTTQGMGSPFSSTQSLGPSHFPLGLQSTQLARNITTGDSRNSQFL